MPPKYSFEKDIRDLGDVLLLRLFSVFILLIQARIAAVQNLVITKIKVI